MFRSFVRFDFIFRLLPDVHCHLSSHGYRFGLVQFLFSFFSSSFHTFAVPSRSLFLYQSFTDANTQTAKFDKYLCHQIKTIFFFFFFFVLFSFIEQSNRNRNNIKIKKCTTKQTKICYQYPKLVAQWLNAIRYTCTFNVCSIFCVLLFVENNTLLSKST